MGEGTSGGDSTVALYGEDPGPHYSCPGSFCSIVACAEHGEMLTNPRPRTVDGRLVGVCPMCGRGALGVLLHREDCLVNGQQSGSRTADQ